MEHFNKSKLYKNNTVLKYGKFIKSDKKENDNQPLPVLGVELTVLIDYRSEVLQPVFLPSSSCFLHPSTLH